MLAAGSLGLTLEKRLRLPLYKGPRFREEFRAGCGFVLMNWLTESLSVCPGSGLYSTEQGQSLLC